MNARSTSVNANTDAVRFWFVVIESCKKMGKERLEEDLKRLCFMLKSGLPLQTTYSVKEC